MPALAIVKIGHEVLRKKADLIPLDALRDAKFRKFLKDMVQTMHHAEGVGLAANQVGVGLQAIVLECRNSRRYPEAEDIPLQTYLNPRILHASKEQEEDWEGCLSIPGYRGLVPRAKKVTFKALTNQGEWIEKTVSGFHARIIQHEVDHLHGFFYVDRMPDMKSLCSLEEFNRRFDVSVRDRG